MKKLLLIVLGVSVVISLILIIAFKSWLGRMNDSMPAEGRAIFAQIDPSKCSAQNCPACAADQCEQYRNACAIKEYKWTSGDKSYFRPYCDAK